LELLKKIGGRIHIILVILNLGKEYLNNSRVGMGESHPQASPRTVREPLDSYGSSQQRQSGQVAKLPKHKQVGIALRNTPQVFVSIVPMATPEFTMLVACPFHQTHVDDSE